MAKIAHLAGLGLVPGASARLEDPKVAAWMLQPSDKERNLSNLAMNFDLLTGNEVGFFLDIANAFIWHRILHNIRIRNLCRISVIVKISLRGFENVFFRCLY